MRLPDHSLLHWGIALENLGDWREEDKETETHLVKLGLLSQRATWN